MRLQVVRLLLQNIALRVVRLSSELQPNPSPNPTHTPNPNPYPYP
jgi:hypothetical protein